LAGQIPLIPASLSLPSPADFPTEVALSLQHVRRIVTAASEGRWKGWMEGGIAWIQEEVDETEWRKRAIGARQGWKLWNQQQADPQEVSLHLLFLFGIRVKDELDQRQVQPPLLLVSAAQLPRSASIEWQVTWQTEQVPWSADEDEASSEDDDNPKPNKMRRIETKANELFGRSASSTFCEPCRSDELRQHSILYVWSTHQLAMFKSQRNRRHGRRNSRLLYRYAFSDTRFRGPL